MPTVLRILVIGLGAGFILQGLAWLVAPARAAAALGMPLLDGLGRSTQVGDFASFFACAGIAMLLGARSGHERILHGPAVVLAGAALGRVVAWAAHGAAFATVFVTVEVAASVLLLAAASVRR